MLAGVVLLLFLLLGLYLFSKFSDEYNNPDRIKSQFTKELSKKTKTAENGIYDLIYLTETGTDKVLDSLFSAEVFRLHHGHGIAYFIYQNDKLIFWSDRNIPVPSFYQYNYFLNSTLNPGNGYYKPIVKKQGNKKFVALIKIKDEYPVSNRYLTNYFLPEYGIPKDAKVTNVESGDVLLQDEEGNTLMAVSLSNLRNPESEIILTIFLTLIISLLFWLLYYITRIIPNRKWAFSFLMLTGSITGLFLFIDFPPFLNYFGNLPIFAPGLYAGKYFDSLGNLILFSFWFLYVSAGLHYSLPRLLNRLNISFAYLFFMLVPAFSVVLIYLFFKLVEDLVLNSVVYPHPDILPDMDFYSISVAASLLVIVSSIRLLLRGIASCIRNEKIARLRTYVLLLALPVSIAGILVDFQFFMLVPAFILSYTALFLVSTQSLFQYLMAAFAGGVLFALSPSEPLKQKRDTEAAVMASKMALENDPITEYLYENVKLRINQDEAFLNGLFSSSRLTAEFSDLLIKKYFNGYWLKYGITAGVFDTKTRSRLNMNNSGVYDFEYYNEIITNTGLSTPVDGLYFVRKPSGRIAYIARLDFSDELRYGNPKRTIFLEFNSRVISETAGLPDILLDNSFISNQLAAGYSYARYTNDRLVNENGTFPYYSDFKSWEVSIGNRQKFTSEGHIHYIQNNDNNDIIIISRKALTFTDLFNRFSWWFLAALLIVGIDHLLVQRQNLSPFGKNVGFKRKIQFVILVTVSAFFIVMVRGSVFFLEKQHEVQNSGSVIEKLHAVAINLEETMGGRLSRIYDQKGYLEYRLSELGNLLGTDINVYGIDGFLISGSRPDLFTSGFISERIEPEAMNLLKNRKQTEFIRQENIGGLKYISAYAPLIDEDGHTVAFLNIPYFSKQKQINEELSASVNSLVNIFIGSITLLLTLVLLVTNRITDPLRELGKRLRELRYGAKTSKIVYQGSDEIGDLVAEYNRLADELDNSAKLLAEQERDFAWREMARQVAHEIKNPLTPMKLNVEFLERAWNDGSPDFAQRLLKFKNIMIEQIDTLSRIADEFSNFAKLPPPQNEKTELNEILKGVTGLYSKNESQVEVIYREQQYEMWVWADKEHLLRVFNNLIKNAIQAIPAAQSGKVEVFAFTDNNTITVLVKDNGTGIPEHLRERIFIPNFTTKSSGSGLGLAICRNIIREAGGNIDFITETGKGTTFRVNLPLYNEALK